jgi:hypothetical protein
MTDRPRLHQINEIARKLGRKNEGRERRRGKAEARPASTGSRALGRVFGRRDGGGPPLFHKHANTAGGAIYGADPERLNNDWRSAMTAAGSTLARMVWYRDPPLPPTALGPAQNRARTPAAAAARAAATSGPAPTVAARFLCSSAGSGGRRPPYRWRPRIRGCAAERGRDHWQTHWSGDGRVRPTRSLPRRTDYYPRRRTRGRGLRHACIQD